MDNTNIFKGSTIMFLCFLFFTCILCITNAVSINQVSTDAFEYGKKNNNEADYNIVGPTASVRGVNIAFAVISILAMIATIYILTKLATLSKLVGINKQTIIS